MRKEKIMSGWQGNGSSNGYSSGASQNAMRGYGSSYGESSSYAPKKTEFISYKFRVYPNALQEEMMDEIFGCVCYAYNDMLDESIKVVEETGKIPTTLEKKFIDYYVSSGLLEQKTLERLHKNLVEAWDKCYLYDKHPKHLNRTDNRQCYLVGNHEHAIFIKDNHINLPQLGLVKICLHREIPAGYSLLNVTIIRDRCRHYYVSILFSYKSQVVKIAPSNFIGLDYSMQELFVDSNGVKAEYPRYYRQAKETLQKEQRRLSRMKKGSENWKRQKIKIAKIYARIANQRKDFITKWAKKLADNYDAVCVEDLSLIELSHEGHFGKSVYDNAWSTFVEILQEKLEKQGKRLIKIGRYFSSSQKCCKCGRINPEMKDFGIREFVCPYCGAHMDRDMNAAINIREEGRRIAR